MSKFDYVFFDMDGTLVDTGDGVKTAFIHALSHYGITAEKSELDKIMGPPLYDSFRCYFGLSDKQANEAVDIYRAFYRRKGLFMDYLYDGMEKVLASLVAEGCLLAVATSKPRVFAEEVLRNHGLTKYFAKVTGSEFDGTRSTKYEVIEYTLSQFGVAGSEKLAMVGDRSYDILGGKRYGMTTVGVLFGYGSEEELKESGADYIAHDCGELLSILSDKGECRG